MYVILIKNKKINISSVKKTYNIIFIFLDLSFLIIYIMNSIVVHRSVINKACNDLLQYGFWTKNIYL